MQPSFEFNISNCLGTSLPTPKKPRLDDPPPLPVPVPLPPRLPPPPVVQPPPPPPASPRPESPEPPEPPESPPTPPPGSPPEPQTAAQKLLHELINGPSAPADNAEAMATEEAPAPDPQSITQKMLDALINGPPAAAPAPLPFLMPPAPTLPALPPVALPPAGAPVDRRHAGLLREEGGVVAWMQQRQLVGGGVAQPEVQDAHGVRLQPDAV